MESLNISHVIEDKLYSKTRVIFKSNERSEDSYIGLTDFFVFLFREES